MTTTSKQKVYVVIGDTHDYDVGSTWVVGVYTDPNRAAKEAAEEELKASDINTTIFESELSS